MKIFTSIVILCSISSSLAAQSFAGKKMLTSTISTVGAGSVKSKYRSPGSEARSTSSNFNINPEFVYGKVNSNNILIAYGFGFGYSHTSSKSSVGDESSSSSYLVQPTMIVQKFLAITEKIYYTPFARLAAGYQSGSANNSEQKNRGYNGSLTFNPLSVTINLKPKTNIIILAGNVGINYQNNKSESVNLGNVITWKSKVFSAGVAVNSFAVGVQLVL